MALGTYTLLDLAIRNSHNVHSLVEGVITYAPELKRIPCLPKAGITYATLTRTALPAGNFRPVGDGVTVSRSEWKREVGSMYLFEAQMKVPEDIVMAAMSENPELVTGDILADEAIATMKGSTINIGSQAWYGAKANAAGFAGISQAAAAIGGNNVLDASAGAGTGVDSTSAYLLYLDDSPVNPQGVHFLLGNGGRMNFSDTWLKQQAAVSGTGVNTKYNTVYWNNFMSYLGFCIARSEAVRQLKNIVPGTYNLTDDLAAKLISNIPLALIQDRTKWAWFLNPQAKYSLRKSRTSINYQPADAKGTPAFAPEPTEICGIPIIETESIVSTERNGAHV